MTAHNAELPEGALFDGLSPGERRDLLSLMESTTFEPGTSIVREGHVTPGLWILTRGTCAVVKSTPRGEHVLAELGPGSVFGEMSFFERVPHAATVRSLTDVTALRLTPEKYAELERTALNVAHHLAHSIASVLAERLRMMDDWTSRLLAESRPEKHEDWADFRAKLYNGWSF
jgi:CRP-like cAMP-binding protein